MKSQERLAGLPAGFDLERGWVQQITQEVWDPRGITRLYQAYKL